MKFGSRIFIGISLIVAVSFYFMLSWLVDDLEPQYRKATEEPLADFAYLLAAQASAASQDGKISVELFKKSMEDLKGMSFEAHIYDYVKRQVDLRVYITDEKGIVVFDSDQNRDQGADYSEWRDVRLALAGEYGARTSRDLPHRFKSSIMYVAAPIRGRQADGSEKILGVVSVGKPTGTAALFVEAAQNRIFLGGVITVSSILIISLILATMVTKPIQQLTSYAQSVRDGKRAQIPKTSSPEIQQLTRAFEEMREALEGKEYIQNYVQTLTHEIKSPLAAIQGASELLTEEMPIEQRGCFLDNIRNEAKRIQSVVERLLQLAALEKRKTAPAEEIISVAELVEEIIDSMEGQVKKDSIAFKVTIPEDLTMRGERFLIRQALSNVIQNAIEFSPPESCITISAESDNGKIEIAVIDQGSGIPDYAVDQVFERFFSLPRPTSGRKSSGLGLTFVREIAVLHEGSVSISKNTPTGTVVSLYFPSSRLL